LRHNACRSRLPNTQEKTRDSLFNTLRSVILSHYPHLGALVQEQFPGDSTSDEAVAYAFELFLRLIPDLRISLDGWKMFRLISESSTSLRTAGITYVLPAGDLPVQVTLSTDSRGTRYEVQIGVGDSRWESLSDRKRWKAVYLYSSGERDEEWHWSKPISGRVADRPI
jgi:hypothetical protein